MSEVEAIRKFARSALNPIGSRRPILVQVGGVSHADHRVDQTVPRNRKLTVLAVRGQNPAVSFDRITAAVPRVALRDLNFPIFQPARIGQALIEKRRRSIRQCIITVGPRRILLRRRWQCLALKKLCPDRLQRFAKNISAVKNNREKQLGQPTDWGGAVCGP